MTKKGVIISISLVALLAFGATGYTKMLSKYDSIKSETQNKKESTDPDGKVLSYAEVKYKANKDKPRSFFKKENEYSGSVSDEELAKEGGKYIKKELMTYRDYVDFIDPNGGIRHDIDPDRMVWVVIIKYDKTHYIDDVPVEKAITTALRDAETGELLSVHANSEDPHGLDKLLAKRPRK
ncbi:MAG: hypothetical protein N3B21_18490 [Clostridia bacterium]|nr:hypothetical protein [Clostridia bacterium]